MTKENLFYDRRDIVSQIKTFLASNLNAPQHLNGEAVLQAIEVQQGILVERLSDVYSFSHLTLQEYLTAQHIVDHNQIQALVDNHLTDTRWKEVFQLVAGLMRGGADELLLSMVTAAENYLQTPVGKQKLVPLLHWAENITAGSQGDLSPIAKRAIANANIYAKANVYAKAKANAYLYAYAYTNANAYAYAKANANTYANACANAYAKANAKADTNKAIEYFISYAQELEKLPEVYQGMDFSNLVTQLKSLKTDLPSLKFRITITHYSLLIT